MIEAERQEAEAIIAELQAQRNAAYQELDRWQNQGSPDRPAGGVSKSRLCLGCYKWRLVIAMISGVAPGAVAWFFCDTHRAFLEMILGNAVAAQLGITSAASLLPLGAIVLDWKIRLYKFGYPGLLRAMANMLAEFKRGLRK